MSWLILIALTIVSASLASIVVNRTVFITIALAIVCLKGHQIVDVFMELKNAPRKWRLLLVSYIVVIPCIIALVYLW